MTIPAAYPLVLVVLVVWLCGDGGCGGAAAASKVWLDDHGRYQNVVVGVHPGLASYNCTELFTNLQNVATRFSDGLQVATDGAVSLGRLQVVLPRTMAQACHLTHLPHATWQTWAHADFRLVPERVSWEQWGPEGSTGVGVRQVGGCGRSGDHITLNAKTVMAATGEGAWSHDQQQGHLETIARSLVGGWARYRWGVFEERGYHGHPRYPLPRTSSQSDSMNCTSAPVRSLLQKVSLEQPIKFCNSDTHDYESLTLQNLACAGRSVSEVIHFHPDLSVPSSQHKGRQPQEEVIRPHSGGRLLNHHDFHVEGDIDRYLESSGSRRKPASGSAAATGSDAAGPAGSASTAAGPVGSAAGAADVGSAAGSAAGSVAGAAADGVEGDVEKDGDDEGESALPDAPQPQQLDFVQDVNLTYELNSTATNGTIELQQPPPALNDTLNSARVIHEQKRTRRAVPELGKRDAPTEPFLGSTNVTDANVSATTSVTPTTTTGGPAAGSNETESPQQSPVLTALGESHNESSPVGQDGVDPALESSPTTPPASPPLQPDLAAATAPSPAAVIRPEAQGFQGVPLELLVAPPPVLVVAIDLSQAAIDEVGVETLRGGLLRWMWGLGGGSRLSILAAYNNESFPLTLSPLPPSPRSAAQLEARLALLPTEQEAATGVYGGRYCLGCVLQQAVQIVQQGGASVESALLVVAACRPKVGPEERRILEASGLTVHTIALCSSAPPEMDQLAGPHGAWVLPSNAGPQDGERQLARTLQAVVTQGAATSQEAMLLQLHEQGRNVQRADLESSGAYALLSGSMHLGTSSSRRLLVLSATSPAKVVEIRDGDGRRLEIVRDTGRRFWVEVAASGELTYTFKFLATSLSFPLHVSEDIYEQRTGLSGVQVHLRTSNTGHDPLVPGSPPLVVWADVTMDGWPLQGAVVTLTVTHLPSGITANYSLLDNGSTEPDLRAGDGVYSRYLTWRLGEGRYALSAAARGTQATLISSTGHDGRSHHSSSGPFSVVSAARTLYVNRVSFVDTAPPSRITDLSVHLVDGGPQPLVNLSWSAPGGELDQGSASRYELKMYTERQALTQERFNGSGITVYCLVEGLRSPPPPPGLYGAPQHCLATVPFADLKWYFAIRGLDAANNTGRVSNIVWLLVPKPPPTTLASTIDPSDLLLSTNDSVTYQNVSAVGSPPGGGWRPYVVAGAAVLGLLMVGAAAVACVCCCRKAKARKEKDPDRPVYKIYVNNAYIQEDDGEIKVVQEWVNSLDKYGNVEGADPPTDGTELKNKASFKYTSPVRFGVLTNGSIMRDATTGSNSSGSSSRPSDEAQHDDYKYRDLSETTSDSTTDGLPPSSSSSAATDVPPLPPQVEAVTSSSLVAPATSYSSSASPAKSSSFKNTNISSLPLPSPRKNPPPTPPMQSSAGAPAPLSLHSPLSPQGYTSEEEGGFRPRTNTSSKPPPVPRGSPPPPRRQLPQHFSSFRYLPPPPQYRTSEFGQYQHQHQHQQSGLPPLPYQQTNGVSNQYQQPQQQQQQQQHSPVTNPMTRANGSLSHGTVRSVKKRRHISFV